MKIVMLDRNTLGMDMELKKFETLGEFSAYDVADRASCKEWIKDADIIIFNKTVMDEDLLHGAKVVKLLCVTATGIDNIDLEYIKKRNILLANVRGYSTPAVVQHTLALALYVIEKLAYYDNYVKTGAYSNQNGFSNFDKKYFELEGKTWGIVGLGSIGKGVAKVAAAFGANVVYYSTSGKNLQSEYHNVTFEQLLQQSDIISIHCPLNDNTRNLFDKKAFLQMKSHAVLINVARGSVIKEQDLYEALDQNLIGGAGLDVLSQEPMAMDHPLQQIKDSSKLIITPHMAWASVEARSRCVEEVYQNIVAFLNNDGRNIVKS